jgi:hypothetical protein
LRTAERSNINTDQRDTLLVPRTNVSGIVTWTGSLPGEPVVGATVRLYDNDPGTIRGPENKTANSPLSSFCTLT